MANVDLAVLTWRKSRACEETNCVEAATAQGLVMVRDSGNAESVTLTFPSRDWAAFVSHMRDDDLHARFPLPGRGALLRHSANRSGRAGTRPRQRRQIFLAIMPVRRTAAGG
jgi:hypothetical protein